MNPRNDQLGAGRGLTSCFPKRSGTLPVGNQNGGGRKQKTDVLPGTSALMVLKTLGVLGPQLGYGIEQAAYSVSERLQGVGNSGIRMALGAPRKESPGGQRWNGRSNRLLLVRQRDC